MAKSKDVEKLTNLVGGMTTGDKRAMETFFEYIDALEDKKLKKDGRHALTMVVGVVRLLLPKPAQLAYAAASDRDGGGQDKTVPKKVSSKKKT
jgi:hypothetical protein